MSDALIDRALGLIARGRELRNLLARETSGNSPTYLGLLGQIAGEKGEHDPLGTVGLGLGASQRARELAIKGLIYEHEDEVVSVMASLQAIFLRGPGRPEKAVKIDTQRAMTVQHLKQTLGSSCRSLKSIIELATQIEDILSGLGELDDDRLFPKSTTIDRLQSSVSTGLGELGTSWRRLLRETSSG